MADCLPKTISFKFISLFLVAVGIFSVLPQTSARADTLDWLSPGATAKLIQDPLVNTPRMIDHAQQCRVRKVLVGNTQTPIDSCIYRARSFRFGWVDRYVGGFNRSSIVISIGNDSKFYAINNLNLSSLAGDDHWQASPASDSIVFSNGNVVRVFNNMPASLDRDFTLDSLEYKIRQPLGDYSFGNQGRSVEVAMSADGRWLAGRMNEYGLFRMRLSDGSVRLFAGASASQGMFKFSISNDGKFIVAGNGMSYNDTDSSHDARIYRVDFDCGKQAAVFWNKPSEVAMDGGFVDCPSVSLNDMLEAAGLNDYSDGRFVLGIEYPRFSETGNELDVLEFRPWLPGRWVRLYAPGYALLPTLDYLALGDSYSSGEGDVGRRPDGSLYYLSGTDKEGQCHISNRSYPFLLRDRYDIADGRMTSVACSGAQVMLDYLPKNDYLGQHKELQNKSDEQKKSARSAALNDFKPGIISQIEFIKKYQPKIITLTGGGNDVGFADMLKYCAYGSGNVNGWGILIEGLYGLSTCSYAIPGSIAQKIVLKQISDQYDYTKLLLEEIRETSPLTDIYLIGYPSFISSDPLAKCHLRSLELNPSERIAIDYYLRDLNLQLSQAAHDSEGVTYINIYDSLEGGKMCQSNSPYITGAFEGIPNMSGWFHPNAIGHQKMADEIYKQMQTPTTISISNEKPNIIGDVFDGVVGLVRMVADGVMNSGQFILIDIPPHTFLPNSPVNGMLHSEPINLGTFQADEQGSVLASIYVPYEVGTGFHLFTLEGETYSGEPLILYQHVVVNPPGNNINNEASQSDEDSTLQVNKSTAVGNNNTEKEYEGFLQLPAISKPANIDNPRDREVNKKSHVFYSNTIKSAWVTLKYKELLLLFGTGFLLVLVTIILILRKRRK